MKRWLSILLAVSMMISMLQVPAFADPGGDPEPYTDLGLVFSSDSPFSIKVNRRGLDGHLFIYNLEGEVSYWMELETDPDGMITYTGMQLNHSGPYYIILSGGDRTGDLPGAGDFSEQWVNTRVSYDPEGTEWEKNHPWQFINTNGSKIYCHGNIEYLLDWEAVANGIHPEMSECCFIEMFNGATALASSPALPAEELTDSCYSEMFSGCTNLTAAPALPAKTLGKACYAEMFSGCTSLTVPPVLAEAVCREPAGIGTEGSYYAMFAGCSSMKINTESSKGYSIPWSMPNVLPENQFFFSGTAGSFTGDPVKGEIYYIKGEKVYAVLFNMMGHGEQIATQSVAYKNIVTKPEDPEAEGWIFRGWYKDSELSTKWNFLTQLIEKDTTLFAKWQKGLKVTFDVLPEKAMTVDAGTKIKLPGGTVNGKPIIGWEVSGYGQFLTTDIYEPGKEVLIHANTAFSAIWKTGTTQYEGEVVPIGQKMGSLFMDAGSAFTGNEKAVWEGVRDELTAWDRKPLEASDIVKSVNKSRWTSYMPERTVHLPEEIFSSNDQQDGSEQAELAPDEMLTASGYWEVPFIACDMSQTVTALDPTGAALVYDIHPVISIYQEGKLLSTNTIRNEDILKPISFEIPVPSTALEYAKVDHLDEAGEVLDTQYGKVKIYTGESRAMYKSIQVKITNFSPFRVSFVKEDPTPKPEPDPDPKPEVTEDSSGDSSWWKSTDAGWVIKPGTSDWYYIRDHQLLKGWLKEPEDGNWYYLDPATGKMMTGWIKDNGNWYYCNAKAGVRTYVKGEDGRYHYDKNSKAKPYGAMYANEVTPDGYQVGASGAWIQ